MAGEIIIRGARTHTLKHVTVRIPKHRLVVLTGPSGSGKSALALDTLDREAQRQYLEALGFVSHQLPRPPGDRIDGLAPTVSVDQHLTNRSPRSTVGTETAIYTYLRVLFAKVGHRPCPACGRDIAPPHTLAVAVTEDADEPEEARSPCPHCGTPVAVLGMAHFAFNKVAGACPTCTGLGVVNQVDLHHLADVANLITVVQGLVDAGNTVVVVAHRLDLVKVADGVIDLGPEGGSAGGEIIAEGPPEQVAAAEGSQTGRLLRPLLARDRASVG